MHAAFELGAAYFFGRGCEKDYLKAHNWWKKAGREHGALNYNLSLMYEKGYGVEQSDERAIAEYMKAAEQDNALAYNALGLIYQKGCCGAPPNLDKARSYFEKALSLGHPEAQKKLDEIYSSYKEPKQERKESPKGSFYNHPYFKYKQKDKQAEQKKRGRY